MGRSRIRKVTESDLTAIYAWLCDEKARAIDGNFLCNWNLTLEQYRAGRLLVYIDSATETPFS